MKQSQTDKLYELLNDGNEHSTLEICEKVYGSSHLGLARVGARIYDLKKKYGVNVVGRHDTNNPAVYWYKIGYKEAEPELINKYPVLFEKQEEIKQMNLI